MSEDDLEVPYISPDEVEDRARKFLAEYAPDSGIPVDVERILEFGLGIDIVPVESLKRAFNIDGWISLDLSQITVDKNQFENHINRCRFTIAHEIGHLVLHREIYQQLDFSCVESWVATILDFNPDKYSRIEIQANMFAGCLLMPAEIVQEIYEEAVSFLAGQGFASSLGTDLVNDYICRWMAIKFNVSEQAMGYRLKNLGLIDGRITDK